MSDWLSSSLPAVVTAAAALGGVWLTLRYGEKRRKSDIVHDRGTRLFDLRRETYAELIKAASSIDAEVIARLGGGGPANEDERLAARARLGELLAELARATVAVELVTGRVETARAAQQLFNATVDNAAARLTLLGDPSDRPEVTAAARAVRAARSDFIAECRRDLGLWIDLDELTPSS